VIRLPDIATEEEWTTSLLERAQVSVHPGHFYDFEPGAPHLVVSLLAPEAAVERGAEAIRREVLARSDAG
jgi:aspartate/methionine/tyrosine aminotransferase